MRNHIECMTLTISLDLKLQVEVITLIHTYILKDLNNPKSWKAAAQNNANKNVIFKTWGPFNNYMSKKIIHKYIMLIILIQ